ncbi:MAG: alpha-hydroxy acid oxidase [Myxococcota bacterium]
MARRRREKSEPRSGADLARRALLRWLLGSPLLALPGSAPALGTVPATAPRTIRSAEDAVDVFDFERLAERALHPGHWTYLSMGVQEERTLRANRAAFDHYALVPRRLVDVRTVDRSVEVLGRPWASPVALAPIGSQGAYHPEAETAVARAARKGGHRMILSHGATKSLSQVVEARSGPVWSQIYAQRTWALTRSWIRRAESEGCEALVLTVDIVGLPTGRDRIDRLDRTRNPDCAACHGSAKARMLELGERALESFGVDARTMIGRSMMLDWSIVDRIRDTTTLPIVLKGILDPEDADQAVAHGVDALVVSNHGGRASDHGRASIEALAEIAPVVANRIPILVDSGFRRGMDVAKALALGARAVCIGRPYVWGLAAFGQEGVEGVLKLIDREFETALRQLGRARAIDLDASAVRRTPPSP